MSLPTRTVTRGRGALLSLVDCNVKHCLHFLERIGIALGMSDDQSGPEKAVQKAPNTAQKLTREDRLAAKLRENLRRRKIQARAQSSVAPADPLVSDDS